MINTFLFIEALFIGIVSLILAFLFYFYPEKIENKINDIKISTFRQIGIIIVALPGMMFCFHIGFNLLAYYKFLPIFKKAMDFPLGLQIIFLVKEFLGFLL